jgi:hypothetical protein
MSCLTDIHGVTIDHFSSSVRAQPRDKLNPFWTGYSFVLLLGPTASTWAVRLCWHFNLYVLGCTHIPPPLKTCLTPSRSKRRRLAQSSTIFPRRHVIRHLGPPEQHLCHLGIATLHHPCVTSHPETIMVNPNQNYYGVSLSK